MTAPHDTRGPFGGQRLPRRSDAHRMLVDHVRFHGCLVELAKLWMGRPERGRRNYAPGEYSCVGNFDGALHDYAENLARCFLKTGPDWPAWWTPKPLPRR